MCHDGLWNDYKWYLYHITSVEMSEWFWNHVILDSCNVGNNGTIFSFIIWVYVGFKSIAYIFWKIISSNSNSIKSINCICWRIFISVHHYIVLLRQCCKDLPIDKVINALENTLLNVLIKYLLLYEVLWFKFKGKYLYFSSKECSIHQLCMIILSNYSRSPFGYILNVCF